MRDIWAGMQADKGLAALQLDESRAMGRVLADAVARARPVADRDALAVTTFLLWDLGEATVRLAIAADETTGARMIDAYTRMASENPVTDERPDGVVNGAMATDLVKSRVTEEITKALGGNKAGAKGGTVDKLRGLFGR